MIDLQGVKVVSWDVDGTLYDLPAMKAHLRGLALRRALRAPLTVIREQRALARLRAAMGRVRSAGGDLSALVLDDDRGWLRELEARWYVEAIRRAGVRPGIPALLEFFAERRLRQVVLSDYASEAKLEVLGLSSRFERSFAGEALGALKPSPRAFQAVLDALAIEPGELLHVGDRGDTDGGAAALGCKLAIISPGPAGAEDLLVNLRE